MNGYQKRTQQKIDAILSAAEVLFMTKGYTATSIQNVAVQAGVSPTSIYNYFGSKKMLLIAVFKNLITTSIEELEHYLDSEASFQDKLMRLVTGNAKPLTPEQNAAMQSIPWDDPAIQSVYQALAEEYSLPLFKKVARLGKREKMIPEFLEEDAVIDYVRSFMPIMTNPGFLQTSYSYKKSIQHLFFFGLLGEVPGTKKLN